MPDVFALTVAAYLLQAGGNFAIAGLLLWLHRSHRRSYLADWGKSWLALGGYHAIAAWSFFLARSLPAQAPMRIALSAASLTLAVVQLAWLARGTREVASGRRGTDRQFWTLTTAISALAIVAAIASAYAGAELRLFVRVGLRSLAAALVLGVAAAVVWRRTRRHRGIGPRLLAGAFLVYGVDQLHYFVVLAANLGGARLISPFPLTGMLDFFLQVGVGLGMTVWLLEDEQRTAKESSREHALDLQRMRLVFEQMPVIVWSTDRETRVLSSAGAGLRNLGPGAATRPGRRLAEYLGTDDAAFPPIAAHHEALAGRSASYDLTWEDRDFHVRVEPLREADGAIVGCVGVALDVTEERRREAAYAETQKLESLGVLAGGIAHDLGNLLTGVLGHAELALRRLPPDSPARPNLEHAIEGATRGGDLAHQLLAYAGRGELRRERIDLGALLHSMGDLLEVALPDGCRLAYSVEDSLPPVVADAAQIRQVVMNLITNASESIGDAAGEVVLGATTRRCNNGELAAFRFGDELAAGDYVALRVADDGAGMDDATQARIFEPFFTTKSAGRGLGLAAVLGIVRRHRGAIRVASAPGRGTEFEILLPAAPPDAAAAS